MTTVTNTSLNRVPLQSAASLAGQQQATVLNTKVAGAKGITMERINAVSQDFEAQFISQMMSSMFSTVDKKGMLGGSEEEDTFQSMLVGEYGKTIARAGGIGIAAQIKQSMLRLQEVGGSNASVSTPAA